MTVCPTLNRFDLDLLAVGTVTPIDVCDAKGRLLVRHGTTLDEDVLNLIHKRCALTFYSPHEWPSPLGGAEDGTPTEAGDGARDVLPPANAEPPQYAERSVSVEALRPGMRLAYCILDDRGVLLLAANTSITPRFLELLRNRNLRKVTVRPREVQAAPLQELHNPLTRRLDDLLGALSRRGAVPERIDWSHRGQLGHTELFDETRRALTSFRTRVADFSGNAPALLEGREGQMHETTHMVNGFLDSIELDMDIVPCLLALRKTPQEYLFHHSMNVSLLAMTMAAHLGYSRPQVYQVGLAGLLQDLGMLKVDAALRMAPRALEPEELLEIQRHPVHTVDILGRHRGLDPLVLFTAYQVHERCDGSGYPRGRQGAAIHPFARIIAVADVYCAMTGNRPYRTPLKPYDAIAAILGEAVFGGYDTRALRALIDCLSLYPVGSLVKLNDGQRARVLRGVAGRYDRPIISIQSPNDCDSGEVVDLREYPDLKVIKVLS